MTIDKGAKKSNTVNNSLSLLLGDIASGSTKKEHRAHFLSASIVSQIDRLTISSSVIRSSRNAGISGTHSEIRASFTAVVWLLLNIRRLRRRQQHIIAISRAVASFAAPYVTRSTIFRISKLALIATAIFNTTTAVTTFPVLGSELALVAAATIFTQLAVTTFRILGTPVWRGTAPLLVNNLCWRTGIPFRCVHGRLVFILWPPVPKHDDYSCCCYYYCNLQTSRDQLNNTKPRKLKLPEISSTTQNLAN
jgi:hypothetical protein